MDKDALVDEKIRDGERLLDRLSKEGTRILAAAWVKPADEDRWSLFVVTTLVDERGIIAAYHQIYHVLQQFEGLQIKDHEIKLVGESNRIASDLLKEKPSVRTPNPEPDNFISLGDMLVENLYVYSPAPPKTGAAKPTVMRFVLRSNEPAKEVLSRLPVQGIVLNSKEWRGKEPRSCAVTNLRTRPVRSGSAEPGIYDIEVSYRPPGSVTYVGGTRYEGWTATVLDRAKNGTLLDGHGRPLPEGQPPVYRSFEVYRAIDFNEIDFGDFSGEFEVEGIKRISFEAVMTRLHSSKRFSMSLKSYFVAPMRHRPQVKIVLSNSPSSTTVDGFGTKFINVNSSSPQLRQVLSDLVTELVTGFVEGKYSLKGMSNNEFVVIELDGLFIDRTSDQESEAFQAGRLEDYLPASYLEELAMKLIASYEIDVSVVDGPTMGLLLKRIDDERQ